MPCILGSYVSLGYVVVRTISILPDLGNRASFGKTRNGRFGRTRTLTYPGNSSRLNLATVGHYRMLPLPNVIPITILRNLML